MKQFVYMLVAASFSLPPAFGIDRHIRKDFGFATDIGRFNDDDFSDLPFRPLWRLHQEHPTSRTVSKYYNKKRIERLADPITQAIAKLYHPGLTTETGVKQQLEDFSILFADNVEKHSRFNPDAPDDALATKSFSRLNLSLSTEELSTARDQVREALNNLKDIKEHSLTQDEQSADESRLKVFYELALWSIDEELHLRGVQMDTQQSPSSDAGKFRTAYKEEQQKQNAIESLMENKIASALKTHNKGDRRWLQNKFKDTLLIHAVNLYERGDSKGAVRALKSIAYKDKDGYHIRATDYSTGENVVIDLGKDLNKALSFEKGREILSSHRLRMDSQNIRFAKVGTSANAGNLARTETIRNATPAEPSESQNVSTPLLHPNSNPSLEAKQHPGSPSPNSSATSKPQDASQGAITHPPTRSSALTSGIQRCFACHGPGKKFEDDYAISSESDIKSSDPSSVKSMFDAGRISAEQRDAILKFLDP